MREFSAVSLLMIDEAARVPDELYKSLLPMLAVGNGDLWLMSTPYGRRGFFYEAWAHGGERWKRVSTPATERSRFTADFLEEERGHLGALWFRQKYLCEFVDNGAAVFDRDPAARLPALPGRARAARVPAGPHVFHRRRFGKAPGPFGDCGVSGWRSEHLIRSWELRIARRLREVGPLMRELLDMQMTVKSNGKTRRATERLAWGQTVTENMPTW